MISVSGMKFYDHLQGRGRGGGGAIDLVIHARGCGAVGAIRWLAAVSGCAPAPAGFAAPRSCDVRWPQVRAWLTGERGLGGRLVDALRSGGLVHADVRGNAVFLCRDAGGAVTGAELVGTRRRSDGSRFRGMATGSRKAAGGFWIGRDAAGPAASVFIAESAIDALSAAALGTGASIHASTAGVCRRLPAWLEGFAPASLACGFDADDAAAAPLRRWLRFLGWLEEPVRDAHPHARQVEACAAWMRDDRGLSEATIGNCRYESDRFFVWAAGRNLSLADIAIGDIDEYLAARIAAGGLRRNTARASAGRLRGFFRFAEARNWCRPGIAGSIMPPLAYPDRPVPKGFDRDEVGKLLAATEGGTPADVRDRAVLMVLATCGLRAGEVGALRVDDIDWEGDRLRVFRPKTGRTDHFPLTPEVGNALMDYLLKVRPDTGLERALFLTLSAPLRPLRSGTVGMIVRSRAIRIGVAGKRRGAHALRHAAAQRLVDEGCGLKTVGDFLGHSSPGATAAYAKIDLASLRPVADIRLKELLDDAA